jgi:hypothetical protein
MAVPASRQDLIDFCLRRLGSPVLEINVDDDQIEDKVDDALQKYQEFHSDASYRTYLKHQVTETDVTNEYIPIASDILFVTKVFPINPTFSTVNMFDIRYQMMLNSLGDFMNFAGGMAYYYQMQQYLEFLDGILAGQPRVHFSRHQNRLYLFGEWSDGPLNQLQAGDYLIAEVSTVVDPDTYPEVWSDMFLKDYTTQLIKQQWGANMMKFEGMQLPGGVQLNGRQYFEEATAELERLEEKMRLEHELPPDFFMG